MHVRVEAKNIPHALERAETLLDSGVMWEPEKIEEVSGEQYNDMMSQLRAFLANGGVMPRMNLAFPLEEGSQLDVGNVVALKPKADDEKPDEGGDADA